jgi:hypothetical protein
MLNFITRLMSIFKVSKSFRTTVEAGYCYHSVNVIKMAKSQITRRISNPVIVINNSDIVISLAPEIYGFFLLFLLKVNF